jgi:hypothetical protein
VPTLCFTPTCSPTQHGISLYTCTAQTRKLSNSSTKCYWHNTDTDSVRAGQAGIKSWWGQGFLQQSRLALWPTQPPIQGVPLLTLWTFMICSRANFTFTYYNSRTHYCQLETLHSANTIAVPGSQKNSAGIVTVCPGSCGSIPSMGKRFFSSPKCPNGLWAHTASHSAGTQDLC